MSGEKNYAEKKLEEFLKSLDDQVELLLPIKNPLSEDIIEALSLDYDQLKSIDQNECRILSAQLSNYSTYVQKMTNRYRNIRRWAENNLNVMVGKYGKNYGDKWMKFEEKKFAIIADDTHAKALYDIWLKYGALEEDLFEMANKIRYTSQTLGDIKNVR